LHAIALKTLPRVMAKRRAGIDAGSKQKALLDRRVAMLTKRGQRGYAVSEELGGWVGRFNTDADADTDADTDTDADSGAE
jgi:hypothetical protein